MNKRKIRILLADDHELLRVGLAEIIRYEKDMLLVGQASNGREAVRLAAETSPDVVVMDLMMPMMNGVEATRRILGGADGSKTAETTDVPPRILILTTYGTSAELTLAIEAGATGVCMKDEPSDRILAAIRKTAEGKRFLSREASQTYAINRDQPRLTLRQVEILKAVRDGLTNQAIGERLNLSSDTVRQHLIAISAKLGTSNRTESVCRAIEQKLL